MSTTRIPRTVEPYKLAANAEQLEGVVPFAMMPRLDEMVGEQKGDCHARLVFDIDEQGQRYIEGHLDARVTLHCQRCLEPMAVDIESDFLLGLIVGDSQAAHLPRQYEPVLVEDEQLELVRVIEDELLLSLPQVVYHQEADCSVSKDQLQSGEEVSRHNPFSVLGALKK